MYLYQKLEAQKRENDRIAKQFENLRPAADFRKDDKYITMMTSMSHTYGNALAFIQDYIIRLFPDDMFKTIHVNSKIAHRQMRSTDHEFLKKSKPMIIFRPRIASTDEERFMQGTPLIERQTDIYSSYGGTNLQPFFEDPSKHMSIKYQMNRDVLYVDVIIILSTLMQQIDYKHYIENAVRIEHPFTIETCLESFIPQEMLQIVSEIANIPLYDANGSTRDFLQYMNQHSFYPITYKLRGGSGNREFFRYYPVNIDTTIGTITTDDGEQQNHIVNNYQIQFQVRLEFNTTGFYYIFNRDIFDIKLPKIDANRSDIIPIFTDVLLKEDLDLQPGWILYDRFGTRLEYDNDVCDFSSCLNESIKAAIDYHKQNGLPLFDLIDIKVRKQGRLMRYNEGYKIDFDEYKIIFTNQDTYHTYSVLICINLEYINSLIKDIYNFK